VRSDPELKLDFNNVLIRPKRNLSVSRSHITLRREFEKFKNYKASYPDPPDYRGVPLMASNMDGVGTFEVAETLSKQEIFTCLVKTYSADELISFFGDELADRKRGECRLRRTEHVAMSIGISPDDFEKLEKVVSAVEEKLKYICIDVANGYAQGFVDTVRNIRKEYPKLVIIAGNVVTGEMTEELILSGADIIKVGIGPGSVCTTRIQTGVGYPQLSAIIECADAAHGLGGHIIADGGCASPGDVAKAFAAGADFVMLGSMLAGTDQGGGEVITKFYETNEVTKTDDGFFEPVYEERKFVEFYGMSSATANDKHFGGLKDYRSSEGRTVLVPYKGDLSAVVQDILGGIRSTCSYVGAKKLKNLSKCTTFVRCSDTHNRSLEQFTISN
jgi:GMP reductase